MSSFEGQGVTRLEKPEYLRLYFILFHVISLRIIFNIHNTPLAKTAKSTYKTSDFPCFTNRCLLPNGWPFFSRPGQCGAARQRHGQNLRHRRLCQGALGRSGSLGGDLPVAGGAMNTLFFGGLGVLRLLFGELTRFL